MKYSASAGRMNKVHISVDGEYAYTVDSEYWYSCEWCRKSEIENEEEIKKFHMDIGSRYAFISGLRMLSYGDNSRRELTRKLVSKGHKPEYAEAALNKLEEYGYINDLRYAQYMVDRLSQTKKMSKRGIRSELLQKGVNRDIVEQILEETEFDPVEDITALIQKKYVRYLDSEKGIKKIISALQRLGYGWSDIQAALNAVDAEGGFYD